MAKIHHHLDNIRLAGRALSSATGERPSPMRIDWRLCGKCSSPVEFERYSAPAGKPHPLPNTFYKNVTVEPGTAHPLLLKLILRCRRCDNCRKARSIKWTYRAKFETGRAARTWFATLTLEPDLQDHYLHVARQRIAQQGLDFDALPYGEQFILRHNAIQPELTKYFKRVRKQYGGALRYLLVAEAHKSGLPHYHALIHQVDPDRPLKYALLKEQWRMGHSAFKLCLEMRQATYLCKYLSKNLAARVRASQGYGQEKASSDITEGVKVTTIKNATPAHLFMHDKERHDDADLPGRV